MSKFQSPESDAEAIEVLEIQPVSRPPGDDGQRGVAADMEHWSLDFRLKVSDLRKSFTSPAGEKIEVLRGASFSALPGEAVAITGPSGAGKSTLLHLLAGLEEPDHGSILAGDLKLHEAAPSALAHFRNRRLGLIFQFHHLLKDLTAVENVGLPLMINRRGVADAGAAAGIMLKAAGLSDRGSHLVGNLSGGEQQRVAVCRALVNRPAIVLADEPTGNLDEVSGDAIAASLVSYARDTPAILILTTHNQSLASLCDRRLMLRDGRLCQI